MKCSICIATYNKPEALHNTLESIYKQKPPFDFEVVLVDDSPPIKPLPTFDVCKKFPVRYFKTCRIGGYQNPAIPRNKAYKMAGGEIVIAQSDDVVHASPNCIENLVTELTSGHFVIATVINTKDGKQYYDPTGKGYGDGMDYYTGPKKPRPLFFLGALYRSDLYAVGGNDEDFVSPSGEDVWFGMCLIQGQKLDPIYSEKVIGHHQHHTHCSKRSIKPSQQLLKQKVKQAERGIAPWEASGGPWPYTPS